MNNNNKDVILNPRDYHEVSSIISSSKINYMLLSNTNLNNLV